MKSIYKNIILFVLLVLGLVIFTHGVVPHDHHFDATCDTSHDSHSSHHHSNENPLHCHLFNEIIVDKAVINIRHYKLFHIEKTQTLLSSFSATTSIKSILIILFDRFKETAPYFDIYIDVPIRGSPLSFLL